MKKKVTTRRQVVKRKAKTQKPYVYKIMRVFGMLLLVATLIAITLHYKEGLAYYFGFKNKNILTEDEVAKQLSDVRNTQVLEKHKDKVIGIDVSQFQGTIHWNEVDLLEGYYPIKFVFIRATAGNNSVDRQFMHNWLSTKKHKFIRGAYHYYRPNENSIEQANLFIKTVKLQTGDLPPVLDIEQLPRNQSIENLKKGLKRWLDRIEQHYQVRPIIYTGERYYADFLKEEFSEYLFWIANYNFYREKIDEDWLFWQFTEKATLPGIKSKVDVNIYNGDLQQLQFITVD